MVVTAFCPSWMNQIDKTVRAMAEENEDDVQSGIPQSPDLIPLLK